MAYFARKDLVRILADKPDIMSVFPECVLSAQQLDDMARIPDIALCDITMLADQRTLERMFEAGRPDAVLPVVIYGGVERARWGAFDAAAAELKKLLTGTWHVHMLQPVVLGAPAFRNALCMYAGTHAHRSEFAGMLCAACMFYRAAVCIPLCKLCGIKKIYRAGFAPCCLEAAEPACAAGLARWCSILPAGYGIALDMALPTGNDTLCGPNGVPDEEDGALFECFGLPPGNFGNARTVVTQEQLQRYFENFAIPFAANIMSRLIAGHAVDFDAVARSLLPSVRKNSR